MGSDIYEMEDWILKLDDNRYKYMLLDRMRQDCDYYLRLKREFGKEMTPSCLWANDEKAQIHYMKLLWNSFSDNDKPEWLTMDQIEKFEKKMCE